MIKVAIYPNASFELISGLCCDVLKENMEWANHIKLGLQSNQKDDKPILLQENMALTLCPFCRRQFEYQYITEPLDFAIYLDIGACDFCDERNRVVKILLDSYELDIGSKCKFGCEHELSSTEWLKGKLSYTVLDICRVELGHMDSKWRVQFKDSEGTEYERIFTRRDYEKAEELKRQIENCTAEHEISKLELKFRIYYD